MTIVVKPFDSYKIKYLSDTYSGISKVFAAISCYNANQIVGVLWFVDTYPIPYTNTLYDKDLIKIHYHTSHFNDIIGILRYEKPLKLEFDTDKEEGSVLTLTFEPVGELE
jgi:hypothetical protein